MPLNDKKIISIILEECADVEERCIGYRQEIREVITDILKDERDHRIAATNIQQKVNDTCSAAARFLSEKLGHDGDGEDDA